MKNIIKGLLIVGAVMTFTALAHADVKRSPVFSGRSGGLSTFTNIFLRNGGALRTGTTASDTMLLQAYDVDDLLYRTFETYTAGNTPTLAIAAPAGGTLSVAATTLTVGGNTISGSNTGDKDIPLCAQVVGYTADIPTGTNLFGFYMPFAFTVTDVFASVNTAGTTDVITVDINEAGTSIISTKITIDATEFTGGSAGAQGTAAAAAVVSDTSIAAFAKVTFDVDDDDGGNTGAGLTVCLVGHKT